MYSLCAIFPYKIRFFISRPPFLIRFPPPIFVPLISYHLFYLINLNSHIYCISQLISLTYYSYITHSQTISHTVLLVWQAQYPEPPERAAASVVATGSLLCGTRGGEPLHAVSLISCHSCHTTHLTPLISYHSSHTTYLTPLISNQPSHIKLKDTKCHMWGYPVLYLYLYRYLIIL